MLVGQGRVVPSGSDAPAHNRQTAPTPSPRPVLGPAPQQQMSASHDTPGNVRARSDQQGDNDVQASQSSRARQDSISTATGDVIHAMVANQSVTTSLRQSVSFPRPNLSELSPHRPNMDSSVELANVETFSDILSTEETGSESSRMTYGLGDGDGTPQFYDTKTISFRPLSHSPGPKVCSGLVQRYGKHTLLLHHHFIIYPVVWLTVGHHWRFYNQLPPLLAVLGFPWYIPFKASPLFDVVFASFPLSASSSPFLNCSLWDSLGQSR